MADFLRKALMSSDSLRWVVQRLASNRRDTGNLFTAVGAIKLLGKWMAEYSAYVRTVIGTPGQIGMRRRS